MLELLQVIPIVIGRCAWRGLVIDGGDEAAFTEYGQDALEFSVYGGFVFQQAHFVEAAEPYEVGVLLLQRADVHTGLAFEREDAFDTSADQPGNHLGYVAVGVDEYARAMLLYLGD